VVFSGSVGFEGFVWGILWLVSLVGFEAVLGFFFFFFPRSS